MSTLLKSELWLEFKQYVAIELTWKVLNKSPWYALEIYILEQTRCTQRKA